MATTTASERFEASFQVLHVIGTAIQADGTIPLLVLDHDATFAGALKHLLDNGVQAAPVYNRKANQWLGMVDVVDLLTYALLVFSESVFVKKGALELVKDEESALGQYPLSKLVDLSIRDPWRPVFIEAPISVLFDYIVDHNIHRMPVVNDAGIPCAIVSQMKVAEFLMDHQNDQNLKEALLQPVSGWALKNVKSCFTHEGCYDAFVKIMYSDVTGLAVLNDDGVGNISASDIKGTSVDDVFNDFTSTVGDFLAKTGSTLLAPPSPICCEKNDSLISVLEKMVRKSVHRVYVVCEKNRPTGVVSIRDVVKRLREYSSA